MTYEELKSIRSVSPVIRLIRARTAPLILSFLFREFKAANQVTIPQYELVNRLADYLEYLDDEDLRDGEAADSIALAEKYLSDWCDEDHRYLRRYPNDEGEPVIELTSYTERAFQWMEGLQKREFVGTESRFLTIYQQLQELIDNTREDPRKKIAELEEKRRAINRQINEIKKTGRVPTFNDTQIKERFHLISRTARELISDFKEVEQNFKEISLNIYKKQTRREMHRGQILGYALDAIDELKSSDQGRSFYAFWQFLIADSKQEELRAKVNQLFRLLQERNIDSDDPFLRHIKLYLHRAGQKIIEGNHLLAEKLSRILGERNLAERRRTREIINDIKGLAVERMGRLPDQREFIEIEGAPAIQMPLERPLGEPPREAAFGRQPESLDNRAPAGLDLTELFDQFEMNKRELEANIDALLRHRDQVRLSEVLEHYPVQKGLTEVLTYFTIATGTPRHLVDNRRKTAVRWVVPDAAAPLEKEVLLPEIVFVRESQS